MEHSEDIKEIAIALAKVQGEMKTAKKDANNPFFKSKYADLASCWDACRELLAKNGLSIVQVPAVKDGENQRATIVLETMMLHTSGQWISSKIEMPIVKNDPQGVGSAITYARRYAMAPMVGIVADEDDDGEAAMGRGDKGQARPAQAQRPAAKQADAKPQLSHKDQLIKWVYGACCGDAGLGLKKDEMFHYMERVLNRTGIASSKDLDETELQRVLDVAREEIKSKAA